MGENIAIPISGLCVRVGACASERMCVRRCECVCYNAGFFTVWGSSAPSTGAIRQTGIVKATRSG
eukprot:789773-Amphidinium_carterae.1